ncbi:hypothetical protein [Bacillus halotolerans]|uniref:hypothetical protein n=1 Tax=Bacillus halotolerans TaxID=260554 RepID=UPI0020788CAE|nr:hypothetical protein [Bacillus halotolerans]
MVKKVFANYKDGDYKRHMAGTALAISPRALGQDRDASHRGYAYREVYSRIYLESIIGFKWAGIVLNSALVERLWDLLQKEVFTEALRKDKCNNHAQKSPSHKASFK